MSKKIIITLSCIIVLIASIITGIIISKNIKKEKVAEINNETVTDECTDEYEQMQLENEGEIEETDSQEEKTSPNCSVIMKRHYIECGHTIEEYSNISKEMVNKTQEEFEKEYQGWTIEKFASNEVIMYREFQSQCGEHYVLRDVEGQVIVYLISGDGTESEYAKTDISTEFLPETDKIELQNGIRANGKQELNQIIENYE